MLDAFDFGEDEIYFFADPRPLDNILFTLICCTCTLVFNYYLLLPRTLF